MGRVILDPLCWCDSTLDNSRRPTFAEGNPGRWSRLGEPQHWGWGSRAKRARLPGPGIRTGCSRLIRKPPAAGRSSDPLAASRYRSSYARGQGRNGLLLVYHKMQKKKWVKLAASNLKIVGIQCFQRYLLWIESTP